MSLGVLLLVHTADLAEGLALVEDAQGQLREGSPAAILPGPPHLALGELLEHLEPIQGDPGIHQALGEPGNRRVSR
jgi:hypothetical protein